MGRGRCGRAVDRAPTERAIEPGPAEGEDAAIRCDREVAARGRCHADDGLIEVLASHRAVEFGPAEGEDAAIRCDRSVTRAFGAYPDDWLSIRGVPGKLGIPECEYSTI